MKKLLQILLLVCPFLSIAQNADFIHHPEHRIKFSDFRTMMDTASAASIGFKIVDIQNQGVANYVDLNYNVYVKLSTQSIDVDKVVLREIFSTNVVLKVDGVDPDNGNVTSWTKTDNLSISPMIDNDLLVFQFNKNNLSPFNLTRLQSASVSLDLNLIDTTLIELSSINLELYVEFERYHFNQNPSITPEFYSNSTSTTLPNGLKQNEAAIYWTHGEKPLNYELEWVYIPSSSPLPGQNVKIDFTKNSVRLQTDKNYMPFNLIYSPGYIAVRGRTVKPVLSRDSSSLINSFEYGEWNLDDSLALNSSNRSILVISNSSSSVLNTLNWQYTANYSNESRKKEVVNFFDGSQRSRQSNTLLNDNSGRTYIDGSDTIKYLANRSTIVSQENYYNYNGQPTISMIPSPLITSSIVGYQDSINYFLDSNSSSKKLTKYYYDHVSNDSIPVFTSFVDGAEQYYSTNNQLLGVNSMASYIPSANGFPYQRTEYMPDGSGRLKANYGLGAEKSMDDTKGTRYFYAKPTKPELERLFGTNVGVAAFYKKQIAIDPNGIINISYVNNKGQTIATSIAGIPEARSKLNEIVVDSINLEVDLIATGEEQFYESNFSYELSYPIFVTNSSVYDFDYSFNIAPYLSCSNVDVCFDCRYELLFQIIDENNQLILEARDKKIEFLHDSCMSESYFIDSIDFASPSVAASITNGKISLTLSAQKQYTIIKKLKLLTNKIEEDANYYIDSSACDFKGLAYFRNIELDEAKFEECETNYDVSELYNPCADIKRGLMNDFRWPNGAFAKGAQLTDAFLPHFYSELLKVSGCNDVADAGYAVFASGALTQFNIATTATFAEFDEAYLDYLIHYHPTYCQLATCEQYYAGDAQKFDLLLERSSTPDEFTVMLLNAGFIDSLNQGYMYQPREGYSFNNVPAFDSTAADTLLFAYDPVMKFFMDDSLISSYQNLVFPLDHKIMYYSDTLNEVIRDSDSNNVCEFSYHLSEQGYYHSYFNNLNRGCHLFDSSGHIYKLGIMEMADKISGGSTAVGGVKDLRWEYYKSYYLNARKSLLDDVISSLVCFEEVSVKNVFIEGQPTGVLDTTNKIIKCDIDSGEYIHPEYSIVEARKYYNYDHFIGTGGSAGGALGRHTSAKNFLDTLHKNVGSISVNIGNQVFALLTSSSCITRSDSAEFVNSLDSNLLICETHTYLDTLTKSNGVKFLQCNPWEINFTPTLKPFQDYFQDQNGNSMFSCGNQSRGTYNCYDFRIAHQSFVTAMGDSLVPTINSSAAININDLKQKTYANWLNTELGLNQNFESYYMFASSCTQNGAVSLLGDTVIWEDTAVSVQAIREAVIRISDSGAVYLSQISDENELRQRIRNAVSNNTINNAPLPSHSDYFGFGEVDIQNNENYLYVVNDFNQIRIRDKILDTIQDVYQTIKDSLLLLSPLENIDKIAYTRRINVSNLLVQNNSNLKIDRAFQYSDGTVWVRVVDASSGEIYNDYYYYYQPNNYVYTIDQITGNFTGMTPILYDENINYIKVTFDANSVENEMVVRTLRPLAIAKKITKIELEDIKGSAEYPYDLSCVDLKYERALITAKVRYQEYMNGKKDSFKLGYTNFCLNKALQKSITNQKLMMNYQFSERQFTLYYYDQADNLVMTVPPAGVDVGFIVDSAIENSIANYRGNFTQVILPNHTKETKYKYNSNNQVIWQSTPNGGESKFWYDKVGRLVLSQNAEQSETHKFSYSLYDNLSRVEESGETQLDFSPFNVTNGNLAWENIHAIVVVELKDGANYKLDSVIRGKTRTNVTKTFYDSDVLTSAPSDFNQENLRSRVATTALFASLNATTPQTNWDYATHYSYDPIGNVKTIVNDYYQNGTIVNEYQRFKRIDYAFDVISGNVQQVYYQMGREDAFYHRYKYDAENRITKVETSSDGIIWDQDANYDYYLHGPLARTELGQNKVQGIDYSYTLEGWLKAVNAGHHEADMGNDKTKDNIFAADAFGFSLNYHQNDYKSIGNVNAMLIGDQTVVDRSDLYNGNIASITKHNQSRTIGSNYEYDQLNRLREMEEKSIDIDSLKWESGLLSDGNTSFYEYDKDGNLLTLHRKDGESGDMMDQLSYNYVSGIDQLSSVNDIVPDTLFSNDIDNQSSNNYEYDEIGNLTKDVAEGICEIRWYPNGKVKRIIRDYPTKEKSDLLFEYDAMGNRVKKTVSFLQNGRNYLRSIYYVRDATGNVMATYEERDCEYYAADDSTGEFYYQYGETFGYYTKIAMAQTSKDSVLNYLFDSTSFSKYSDLLNQSYLNLIHIPNIRDSIIACMNIGDYFTLYPQAFQRVVQQDGYFYADVLYNNNLTVFTSIMNYKNEAYIQYLIENNIIIDFYKDLDVLFANNGSVNDISLFMSMNQSILMNQLYNASYIKQYLNLSTAEYNEIINLLGKGAHIDALKGWIEEINESLLNGSEDVETQLKKINALLLLIDLSEEELVYIFEKVDLNNFYGAFSWLPTELSSLLNTVLHHSYIVNNSIIDVKHLNTYEPSIAVQWLTDTNGDHLIQFLKIGVANGTIIDIMVNYFDTITITGSSTFFDGSQLFPYAQAALEHHWQIATLQSIILSKSVRTKVNLALTEDLGYLINYFQLFHPKKTILQNFYHDSLNFALSGLSHYSPFDYAQELVDDLGVNFGPLGGCNPHVVYLVPEQYNIYGSSRLGTMNAKQRRKVAENEYSRKLGAKNYELSDHLGNVVATVSDKKIHPLELLVNGNYNVDATIGYQADVTGRYDYYPFGMEIMSRSGSFSTINYTSSTNKLIYNGLLSDCDDYTVNDVTENCEKVQNIYGQYYIDKHELIDEDGIQFPVFVNMSLSEIIPNLDSAKQYVIEVNLIGTEYRPLVASMGVIEATVSSLSAGSNASEVAINNASDKTVQLSLTGAEILAIATNGYAKLELTFEHAAGGSYNTNIEFESIKVFEIENNSSLPFAKRMSNAYPYGFNGMERSDEVSGSGNSYTAEFWQYDSRLGRRWNQDPRPVTSISPYATFQNNPVMYSDPYGDSVKTIFDKSANTLYMYDLDHYKDGLPTAYVGPDQYEQGGVYDDEGNLAVNQVLVIRDVFTGGASNSEGITYGNNENQKEVPDGTFEILEYSSSNSSHDGWYRLDPLDSSPRNDQYDNPNYTNADGNPRSNIRFHIGSESWGCVTCNVFSENAVKGFQVISTVLQTTTTREVRDRLGFMNSIGLRDTRIKKYGEMKIVE
jgi:hypothetical protein